ncbi:MAG: tetratricopeptide repeat protein [Magnetococcales bacterium]|nr:tetratricopeptide repeat protein [Magnetococcales bacterium]
MNRLRVIFTAIGLIACLQSPLFAAAESLDDIYALADRKEFDTALKKLNTFLADHPQDAQGRFLKGLIFTETKQFDQAISVFSQLSKDFPELPEPYNNLAVLYAERGQFEKAQEALLQAVKNHPNYSTAHENLGDIYAKMASQAYTRALKLNQGNGVLTSKLNKVKTLFTDGSSSQEPVKNVAAAPLRAPALGTAPRGGETPAPPVAAPAKEATTGSMAGLPAKEGPRPPVTHPPVTPPPAPSVGAAPPSEPQPAPVANPLLSEGEKIKGLKATQEVQQAVHAWAAAWSAKNLNQYLAAYSQRFQPFNKHFKTRSEWEQNRREKIGKAGEIHVQVSDLQVTMLNEDRAQTTFLQSYTANKYRDQVKKTLSLERENNAWKIVREYAND